MANEYQCPKCRSHKIRIRYPDIKCLSCGWSEPLTDYPISWSEHRSLCVEYGRPDPGPLEPPEHDLEELHERVLALEERPQPTGKPGRETTPPKETEPRLYGGVSL